ncbi:MAG: gliding motility-associated C-terminal domain-containing protein [Chitinophagales bacterium]|nr:gliding motility-associated C-terminal domain-containing protein [Chitinophagales bacterium]
MRYLYLVVFLLFIQLGAVYGQCVGTVTITPSLPPNSGGYAPGTVVTYCVSINGYSQPSANWFHGVTLSLGPGWDAASLTPTTISPSCDGGGAWLFRNLITSSFSGQSFGPGFYYDRNPQDGNPGNNFGDNCTSYTWTFCFQITVNNNVGASLIIGVNTTSDNESGSWGSNGGCAGDPGFAAGFNDTVTSLTPQVTFNIVPPCSGQCNGSITANVTGAPAPYTYAWSNAAGSTQTISGFCGGESRTVTVTAGNGSTVSGTAVVPTPSVITVRADSVNVTCNGAANGRAYVTVTGAGSTPTYSWNTTPVQTSDTARNLGPGTYRVTVTVNGCTFTDSTVITQPTALTRTFGSTNVTCNGAANGTAWVVPSGGTLPYSYTWSNTATTDTIRNLTPGTYSVTVRDANLCSVTASVTITQPNPTNTVVTADSADCFGSSDGQAAVIVISGAPPYTYSWSTTPAQTTNVATGLSAGTYYVTTTDTRGCTKLDSVIIGQPIQIVSNAFAINASCSGSSSGSAYVQVSGGSPPYTYSWNTTPASTNDTIFNQPLGTYIVTVRDARNCIVNDTASIGQPSNLTVALSNDSVDCAGGNTGSAWATAAGGTPPYTYLWSNSPASTTDTATGLIAGTYFVTVTDFNGCQVTGSTSVREPAFLITSVVRDSAECFGASDGGIDLSVNGGTAPYTYLWSNTATTQDLTGLLAANYAVTVTDARGCTVTVGNINVLQPAALAATYFTDSVSCFGGNDGLARVVVTGGSLPYNYSWGYTSAANNDTASGLSAGPGSVTVTDGNLCTVTATGTVLEPTGIGSQTSADSASCSGGGGGQARVFANGGSLPYSYAWNTTPVQTNDTAFNLTAGVYRVTITDANGCQKIDSARVLGPGALNLSISNDSVSCFGGSDGAVYVSAVGGTQPISFSWSASGVGNNDTALGLIAGLYTITITDGNGCSSTISSTVQQPSALSATYVTDSVNCFGGNDGSITVTVTGGSTPYAYQWTGSSSTGNLASGLAANTYSLTITDRNNCIYPINNILVSQPTDIVLNATTTDARCFNSADGSIALSVSGGLSPYSYAWTNSISGQNPTGLAANTYSVTVSDRNNCRDSLTAVIAEPTPIVASGTVTDVNCYGGNDGQISLSVAGGTPNYTYNWTGGASGINPTNLGAGGYQVTISDYNQCDTILTFTVNEPDSLFSVLDLQGNAQVCDGASLAATISDIVSGGTPPYSYSWNLSPQNSSSITASTYGIYTAIVTDANGCSSTASYNLTQPTPLTSVIDTTPVSCYGFSDGTATVIGSGGFNSSGSYVYLWSNGGDSTNVRTNLSAGSYSVVVVDDLGCTTTSNFTIESPNNITVDAGPEVSISVGSDTILEPTVVGLTATDNVSYTWSPNTGLSCTDCANPIANPIDTTVYLVKVDVNGCVYSDSVVVNSAQSHIFYAPNAFSPNGDGQNDIYQFYAYGIRKFEFKIYDRWGNLVFTGHSIDDKWDGTYKGKEAGQGVYVYHLYCEYLDRVNFRKEGGITLIR